MKLSLAKKKKKTSDNMRNERKKSTVHTKEIERKTGQMSDIEKNALAKVGICHEIIYGLRGNSLSKLGVAILATRADLANANLVADHLDGLLANDRFTEE